MRSSWKSIVVEEKLFLKKEKLERCNFSKDYKRLLQVGNLNSFNKDKLNVTVKVSNLKQKFELFLSYIAKSGAEQKEIKIWRKSLFILYKMTEQPYRVGIYNGRILASILVNELKNGSRYGEFIFTKGVKVVKEKGKNKKIS